MNTAFLTYDQQLDLLRHEKNISCDTPLDHDLLRRIGYFNLVHGYRPPFLTGFDQQGSGIYLAGTRLSHLAAVKEFDDALRHLMFRYITQVEEEVRTFAAYAFSEANGGLLDWKNPEAYPKGMEDGNFRTMMHRAVREVENCDFPYVRGYLERRDQVPAFVMCKIVYLFTFIAFLEQCKPQVKSRLCNLYGLVDGKGYPDHKLLISSLHWMRQVRNVCAHNERLFTYDGATRGQETKRRKAGMFQLLPNSYTRHDSPLKLMDLLVYFKYFLDETPYDDLMAQVIFLLTTLESRIPPIPFSRVRANMGIRDLHHLTRLRSEPKSIHYYEF